jgi:hypothetical protein
LIYSIPVSYLVKLPYSLRYDEPRDRFVCVVDNDRIKSHDPDYFDTVESALLAAETVISGRDTR